MPPTSPPIRESAKNSEIQPAPKNTVAPKSTGEKPSGAKSTDSRSKGIRLGLKPKKIDFAYLEKRKIGPPVATALHLWGLIIGYVIPGLFYAYNYAYQYGFGSTIIAYILAVVVFVVLSATLADLGSAFPFSSGCAAYSYAAFGGVGATIVGYAYTIAFIMLCGAQLYLSASILGSLLEIGDELVPTLIVPLVMGCVLISLKTKLLFNISTTSAIFACIVVVISSIILATQASVSNLFVTIMPDGTQSTDVLPFGFMGLVNAFAYCITIFVGFEAAPVAAEETIDVEKALPKASWASVITMVILSIPAIILCAALPPDPSLLSQSQFPLVDGMAVVFELETDSPIYIALNVLMLPGVLLPSLNYLYGSSRYMYGLARGGYLPSVLALTSSNDERVPYFAVLTSASLAFVLAMVQAHSDFFYNYFLNTQTVITFIGYLVDAIVFIKLCLYNIKYIPRPSPSPFGIPGALICVAILGVFTPSFIYYQFSFMDIGITYGVAIAVVTPYYWFVIWQNLVMSPEHLFIRKRLEDRKNAEKDKPRDLKANKHQVGSANKSNYKLNDLGQGKDATSNKEKHKSETVLLSPKPILKVKSSDFSKN